MIDKFAMISEICINGKCTYVVGVEIFSILAFIIGWLIYLSFNKISKGGKK
jgi:hypothetical protein